VFLVREVYETALPVADYSTYESESLCVTHYRMIFSNAQFEFTSLRDDNLAPLPENDGFVSASEELEEIE